MSATAGGGRRCSGDPPTRPRAAHSPAGGGQGVPLHSSAKLQQSMESVHVSSRLILPCECGHGCSSRSSLFPHRPDDLELQVQFFSPPSVPKSDSSFPFSFQFTKLPQERAGLNCVHVPTDPLLSGLSSVSSRIIAPPPTRVKHGYGGPVLPERTAAPMTPPL